MQIKQIFYNNDFDLISLQNLLLECVEGTKTFRYFEKRGLEEIKNHLMTFLYYNNDKCVGYGHLEKENNIVWLGILVSDLHTNKGFGKKIMDHLLNSYDGEITLSVDKKNHNALSLYKNKGFTIEEEKEYYYIMKLNKQ
jgi:ribosomal protein S18 acetylase RimI-like enzyme